MEILITFALIGLIIWAIVTKDFKTKRIILISLLILSIISALAMLSQIGFSRGLGGIIGTLLLPALIAYFIYKIKDK